MGFGYILYIVQNRAVIDIIKDLRRYNFNEKISNENIHPTTIKVST